MHVHRELPFARRYLISAITFPITVWERSPTFPLIKQQPHVL